MYLDKQPISKWKETEIVASNVSVSPSQNVTMLAAPARTFTRQNSFLFANAQHPSQLETEAIIFDTNDLLEINFVDRLQVVSKAICRITIQTEKNTEFATGFLVGPGLLLTNNHVLPNSEIATFAKAEFGYRYDLSGKICFPLSFELVPETFFLTNFELDYSLCAVAKTALDRMTDIESIGHLKLIPELEKIKKDDFVTVIQHPEGQPMQIALRENKVLEYGVDSPVIWYGADTAPGSSGSPVFNDFLEVVALHQSGRIKRDANGRFILKNGNVADTVDGLTEYDVVWEANVGTLISRICKDILENAHAMPAEKIDFVNNIFHSVDILTATIDLEKHRTTQMATQIPKRKHEITAEPRFMATDPNTEFSLVNNSMTVPLNLQISLGTGQHPTITDIPLNLQELQLESAKMQIPIIYDGLNERKGFDSTFLELNNGQTIELPVLTALGKEVVAPLLDGNGYVLKYKNFSVVMHKERRLALYTASNVDWRNKSRPINPLTGRVYSREQYTGISHGANEQWVIDDRISREHQLPDIFYNEDRKAFDKGHIVRCNDVCWGNTFEEAQMASGDTYHVTNCSPQVKEFNRSSYGKDNWGDLENEIQKITKSEKVIVFTGPVFNPIDRWFRGTDDKGPLKIQIPTCFWKIVVAAGVNGPEAYGFVLEQNITSIFEREIEFEALWKIHQRSINEIENMMRGWVDLSTMIKIDQYKG